MLRRAGTARQVLEQRPGVRAGLVVFERHRRAVDVQLPGLAEVLLELDRRGFPGIDAHVALLLLDAAPLTGAAAGRSDRARPSSSAGERRVACLVCALV